MKSTRLILHTKLTGEIVLSIFLNRTVKFAEIPMGADPKKARTQTQAFIAAMSEPNDFIDEIT